MCQGKAEYKPKKGMENRMHVIGEGDNPVLILKKGEVPKLFNDFFWYVYDLWKTSHFARAFINFDGLDLDDEIIEYVSEIERHYQSNFSMNYVIVKYLEALLRKKSL